MYTENRIKGLLIKKECGLLLQNDTMRLIWATNENDPRATPMKGYLPLYHGKDVLKRGVKSTFMKVRPNPRKFPDQQDVYPEHVKHVDLTVKNVVVPKKETYYYCNIVKFPRLLSKHHIIAVRKDCLTTHVLFNFVIIATLFITIIQPCLCTLVGLY